MDEELPDCFTDKPYKNIKDKGKFWYDSGAEQWIDKYISAQKDHSQWAQNLYRELFRNDVNPVDFACFEPGEECNFEPSCGKFFKSIFWMFINILCSRFQQDEEGWSLLHVFITSELL